MNRVWRREGCALGTSPANQLSRSDCESPSEYRGHVFRRGFTPADGSRGIRTDSIERFRHFLRHRSAPRAPALVQRNDVLRRKTDDAPPGGAAVRAAPHPRTHWDDSAHPALSSPFVAASMKVTFTSSFMRESLTVPMMFASRDRLTPLRAAATRSPVLPIRGHVPLVQVSREMACEATAATNDLQILAVTKSPFHRTPLRSSSM